MRDRRVLRYTVVLDSSKLSIRSTVRLSRFFVQITLPIFRVKRNLGSFLLDRLMETRLLRIIGAGASCLRLFLCHSYLLARLPVLGTKEIILSSAAGVK